MCGACVRMVCDVCVWMVCVDALPGGHTLSNGLQEPDPLSDIPCVESVVELAAHILADLRWREDRNRAFCM